MVASKKATAYSRGYDKAHLAKRKWWKIKVDRGEVDCHAVVCLMPTRRIKADEPWDLGHDPSRTTWTGPEHMRCNRSEGATRGNQMKRNMPRSRNW